MQEDKIVQYVRDSHRNRVGVVVAIPTPDANDTKYSIGWSKCCKKDKFNIERGLMIAVNRAKHGLNPEVEIPRCVQLTIEAVVERAVRYYK